MEDPFETVIGMKSKFAIVIFSLSSILTCTLAGNYTIGMSALTNPSSSTLFVWEFVRHGARAPVIENDESDFSVGVEQLTPQGMRQRYLLGKYQALLNQRFGGYDLNTTNLLKTNYRDMRIQSTDFYRTIMSGYSELLGFDDMTKQYYNENMPDQYSDYLELSLLQATSLIDESRGTVPFKTRRSAAIKTDLQKKSIIPGYSRIPIYTYMERPIFFDDIETRSCDYVKAANDIRWDNETYGDKVTFKDVMYLRDDLRDKYAIIMNLDEAEKASMTFKDAYHYADLVFS
jgi:hypothetical protein